MGRTENSFVKWISEQKMILILIIVFLFFSVTTPGFITFNNLSNMFLQTAAYGITACAFTFLIIVGQIDIGVGATISIGSIAAVATINATGSIFLGLLAALGSGVIIGIINGVAVILLKIDSFIVTLATMSFMEGMAYLLTPAEVVCKNERFSKVALGTPFGLTNIVIVFFACVLVMEVVLRFTTYGRNICATGGNRNVARYTGINTEFFIVSAFVLTGIAASFSGFMLASRLNASSPSYATDAALQCISAIILGGTSLSGGRGGVIKTFCGLMVLTILSNALNLLGVYSYYQTLIKGIILVLIVAGERFHENRIK